MDTEASSVHGRAGIVIVIVVAAGILVLGAGGYLAWSKRQHAGAATGGSDEASQWCQLRQEWQKQADPIAADIMLKSVNEKDRPIVEQLQLKRNKIGEDFGRRIAGMQISEQGIASIEAALVKEGKARANTAVEIHNLLSKIEETEDTGVLGRSLALLRDQLRQRIRVSRATTDQEVASGLKVMAIRCPGLYRGPATDEGTSDSPYITWDELELRRSQAEKQYEERLKRLEPLEEYTNRVYHEMIRQYRPLLVSCHKKAKTKNSKMSDKLGLRVRLKRSGEVKTLAIEWMDTPEDSFLDCLLEKASKWKLPRPGAKSEVVVVTLDFAKI